MELRLAKLTDASRAHLAAMQMRANLLDSLVNFPATVKERSKELEKTHNKLKAFKESQEGGEI